MRAIACGVTSSTMPSEGLLVGKIFIDRRNAQELSFFQRFKAECRQFEILFGAAPIGVIRMNARKQGTNE